MSGARSREHAANKQAVTNYNGSGSHMVKNKSVQQERNYSDTYGDPVGGASGEGQRKRRKMKMWVIIALLALGGVLAYFYFGDSNAEPQVANNEVTVDSTQIEIIETPYQKQTEQKEKRIQKQEIKAQPERPQEVTPKPVNEEPAKEVKYAPNGEPLLEKPKYPKNGNLTKEWLKKKKEYDEQQLRIIEWREKHGANSVYVEYKEPSFEEFLAYRLSRSNRVAYL